MAVRSTIVCVIPAFAVEEQFGMAGEEIAGYPWQCVFKEPPFGNDFLWISGGTRGHLLKDRVLVGGRQFVEKRQCVRHVDVASQCAGDVEENLPCLVAEFEGIKCMDGGIPFTKFRQDREG
jgi:hypothetical protein